MVSWLRLAPVGRFAACASSGRRVAVDSYWLVGAFVGSGLFMFVGGPLVRRLLQTVRRGAPD